MEAENNPISKWRRIFCFLLMVASILTGSICSSILAPIYPLEAASKDVPASQFGFVFGVFQLVYCFISPIYGAYAKAIGPISMFRVGTLTLALCTVSFGFLNRSPSGAFFLALSIVLRIFSALGDSAVYISGFILATGFFPKTAATTVAAVETSYVVGIIIGPTVGSALLKAGGFSLPFFVIGALLMLFCLGSLILFQTKNSDAVETNRDGPKVTSVIRNPLIIITSFVIFASCATPGFIQALLENHLNSINLSQEVIGVIYMAMMGGYAVSSVICGQLADKIGHFNVTMVVGLVTAMIGLVLIGPAPFLPLPLTVKLVVTSLILIGVGCGCVMMNGFMEILSLLAGDGPRTVATRGFASGLYTSVVAFGFFVGPTVGGPLYDLLGFSLTSMVMLGLELLSTFLVVGVLIIHAPVHRGHSID